MPPLPTLCIGGISLINNNKCSTYLPSTGGTDTSRYTLMWVLLYMAKYPECQKILQEEVNKVAGQYVFKLRKVSNYHSSISLLRLSKFTENILLVFRNLLIIPLFVAGKQTLTMADRSQLHYTNAVLHETIRIRTLVPFALPHKTTCDTTIGKH